jgi:hypothetical protein
MPLTYAYDDQDRITSWTDRNTHWYACEYGPDGRVVRGHGPQGALEARFAYDTEARAPRCTRHPSMSAASRAQCRIFSLARAYSASVMSPCALRSASLASSSISAMVVPPVARLL